MCIAYKVKDVFLGFGYTKSRSNTSLDIIDLALPGYLPTINKKAVEYGILVCDALHCTIDPVLRFDRKNYAYPDLPKGFQITQQFYPLGKNGYMMIEDKKSVLNECIWKKIPQR